MKFPDVEFDGPEDFFMESEEELQEKLRAIELAKIVDESTLNTQFTI